MKRIKNPISILRDQDKNSKTIYPIHQIFNPFRTFSTNTAPIALSTTNRITDCSITCITLIKNQKNGKINHNHQLNQQNYQQIYLNYRKFHTYKMHCAKTTFQVPKSITNPSFSVHKSKLNQDDSFNSDSSVDYVIIYKREKTNRSKYISLLMIFFGLACLMQADTSWRYKLMKVNQLIKMDIGPEGMLPSTATSSKIPSYIRSLGQSELKPTDGKVKAFFVIYGNAMLFLTVGFCLLFGTKFAMRHFGVIEMGYFPGTGRGKIVLPKWHGCAYYAKEFAIRDAQFMSARAASQILLHDLEDVAIKIEDESFYYRLSLGDKSKATFDEERFHSMIRQSGKKFKVSS